MSSLGHDLASVRKQQNLTLEEVQAASKIPLVTLKAIEDDSIFEESDESPTYIRSFVRSYAKVLKIDDERVLASLDAVEKNNYQGELVKEANQEEKKTGKPVQGSAKKFTPDNSKTEKKTGKNYRNAPEPPTIHSVNWADLGKRFIIPDNKSKIWVLIIAVIALILTVSGLLYFFGGSYIPLNTSNEPENDTSDTRTQPPAQLPLNPDVRDTESDDDTLQIQANTNTPLPQEEVSQNNESQILDDTLSLVVYAAFDKLDPVRITSDLSWRTNPYWMEKGEAYYFDFKDTVLVRGQYSNMILLLNGHIIENFRQNYFDPAFNSVMLTRSIFENNTVFTEPIPQNFPFAVGPPDSIVYPTVY